MAKATGDRNCNNCRLMRKGDCCGFGKICEDFEAAYNVSEEELILWPGVRDRTSAIGVHYRSQTKRLKGEFGYYKDRSYYAYEYDDHGNRRYGVY